MLRDKVAVVTGGAQGIGLATTRLFLKNGAKVVVADLDRQGGQRLVDAEGSDRVAFVHGDVRDHGYLKMVRDTAVSKFGGIDVWVNNAGVGFPENSPKSRWRDMVKINLVALIEGTQLALEHMEAAGSGVIVQMASMAGLIPASAAPVYAATKAGTVHYTRSTAARLLNVKSRVKVFSVCPVYTDTKLVRQMGDKIVGHLEKSQDGMLLKPEDVACGVLELCAGLPPGSVCNIGGDQAVDLKNSALPSGSTLRVYVKQGKAVRDVYDFPIALGGKTFRKRSKL